jgi:hypothetical protein
VVVLLAAALGWALAWRDAALRLAFLPPVLLACLYLLLPGAHASARFFCFLLPPVAMGLAGGVLLLWRSRVQARMAGAGLALAFLVGTGHSHARYHALGNPDLKGMARRMGTARVVLAGAQSDLNVYYFRKARVVSDLPREDPSRWRDADYVVWGSNQAPVVSALLLAHGFEVVERYEGHSKGNTSFLVYRQGGAGRNGIGR